ncbi:MAG: transcription termination/antitermination protein NusG [Nitrospirae bacterium]|nr:transcription termination/antitermination protein NusG [Nitrospirota bacterium]
MAKKWYVVHTYSGFEEKVKTAIEDNIQRKGLEDKISQVLIPTEKIVELKSGKKREINKKFYPGYILIEMDMDDEAWHLVRSTPRVTGFVGGKEPEPIQNEEVDVIIQQIEKGHVHLVKSQFDKGDNVRITDGPFSSFNGYVDKVDTDHNKLWVMVTIFGRQTPVELNFLQVEKA